MIGFRAYISFNGRSRRGETEKGRGKERERREKWKKGRCGRKKSGEMKEKREMRNKRENEKYERWKKEMNSQECLYTAPQESTIARFSSDWSLLLPGSATQGCTLVQLTAARRSCLSCWSIDYLRLSICMWELKCNCRSSCHFPCRLVGTPLTSAPRRSWSKCWRTLWRICIMLDALVM